MVKNITKIIALKYKKFTIIYAYCLSIYAKKRRLFKIAAVSVKEISNYCLMALIVFVQDSEFIRII